MTLNNMRNYNFDHIQDTKKGITSPLTAKNINNFLTNKSDLPEAHKGKTPNAQSATQKFDLKRNTTNNQKPPQQQYMSERQHRSGNRPSSSN